jgi:flagellar protein FlaI
MAIEHRAKTQSFKEAMSKFPHFARYIEKWNQKNALPKYVLELDRSMKGETNPNIIYPVGDPIFIHVYKEGAGTVIYHAIEPELLTDEQKRLYNLVQDKMIEIAHTKEIPTNVEEMRKVIKTLFEEIVELKGGKEKRGLFAPSRMKLGKENYELLEYMILRNRVGYGKLDPIFSDPYLEDIHCTGVGRIMTIHKIFGFVFTSIVFKDDLELNRYVIDTSERVERPCSDARSVVDAVMPDGSRANFIYGRDVSLEGTSFTLRKFSEVPISITQIVNWGTMSSEVAAYMWLCLENGMNVFVCGETASGKTTSLNGMCAFIKPLDKIYTVENTPEVTMPHECWQHLLTRESGKKTDVTYLTLLIAALRSRPNYIIVGEIRGEEGNIAFQAMQTGHPVMSTFHAGNVKTMIQRITSQPINVPIAFIDNLNICLIQMAVMNKGKMLRRVLSVSEIERYYSPAKQVVTREVFQWNPSDDSHKFKGMFNSYILEQKIAKMQGYEDTRLIYKELKWRQAILDKMVDEKVFNYYDVWEIFKAYHFKGKDGLPWFIRDPREE